MDLIAFNAGHDAPKETFYEFKNQRFMVDEHCRTEKGALTFF